ncbi:MAG: alpha-ketoacid dehydrogenase subunit beta, partial [Rhodospirillaceae bacterium]|nr:alpha-ketoacid dehydrogenase subunit beta [Rhodospirillaceae bacterium]
VPGLKVVAPTTAHDAKGCLIAAIRDNNPVVFIEHRMLYGLSGHVAEESYEVPFGQARILAEGGDITIVAISHMVIEALRARWHLEAIGIAAEVIDPVSLSPIDWDSIVASVEKTGRLLVVDNGWLSCGASAEIIAETVERLQGRRSIAVGRMGFAPSPCPTTRPLEQLYYPNDRTIASRAHSLVKGNDDGAWMPEGGDAAEVTEFRGPF